MTWEFWYKLGSLGTRMPIITNAISGLFSIGLLYNERLFLATWQQKKTHPMTLAGDEKNIHWGWVLIKAFVSERILLPSLNMELKMMVSKAGISYSRVPFSGFHVKFWEGNVGWSCVH